MITVPDIEKVMNALALVLQGVQTDPAIETVSRQWVPWDQLSSLAQPAIIILEPSENEKHRRGQSSQVDIEVQLLVLVTGNNQTQDPKNPPISRLNKVIRGIRTALLPSGADVVSNTQTLGGCVSDCYISGKVRKDAGVLDEQMSALIPLTITIP